MLGQLDPMTNLIFMFIQTLDCLFASSEVPGSTRRLQETSEVFKRLHSLRILDCQSQLPLKTTVAQILPDAQCQLYFYNKTQCQVCM